MNFVSRCASRQFVRPRFCFTAVRRPVPAGATRSPGLCAFSSAKPVESSQSIDELLAKAAKDPSSPIMRNTESTARDHLANERTWLAWFRTSLGCVALSVPLHEVLRHSEVAALHAVGPFSLLLSTGVLAYATRRYFANVRLLQRGYFRYNRKGVQSLAVIASLFCGGLLIIFVASDGQSSFLPARLRALTAASNTDCGSATDEQQKQPQQQQQQQQQTTASTTTANSSK